MERFVELINHLGPLQLPLGNFVELLFNLSGKVVVDNIGEILNQEIVYHNSNIAWEKFSLFGTGYLNLLVLGYFSLLKGKVLVRSFNTRPIFLNHISRAIMVDMVGA